MPFTGGCLCGEIRYEIDRAHLNGIHCYCSMCRRAHGTAFSTHVLVRRKELHWTREGERVPNESSPGMFREFCSKCGTHIFVHSEQSDGTAAIPAGTLDGDPALTIKGHIFTDDRVSWYTINDDLPQHAGWPPGMDPKLATRSSKAE